MESRNSRQYKNIALLWIVVDSLRAEINVIAEGPWRAHLFFQSITPFRHLMRKSRLLSKASKQSSFIMISCI